MKILKDLQYLSDSIFHTLDLYLPLEPTPTTTLLVYIHGGAWRTGDKDEFHTAIDQLSSNIAVASINYRLSQKDNQIKHPDHLNDCQSALHYLLSRPEGFQNLYLVGHSAGAHLATMLALSSFKDEKINEKIRGIVGVSGIYDIPKLLEEYPDYLDFIEMAFRPEDHCVASPQMIASREGRAEHIRFLIVNSCKDELVNPGHAARYAEQLVSVGYQRVQLVVGDFGGHHATPLHPSFIQILTNFISDQ